jgi:hypothetical protein
MKNIDHLWLATTTWLHRCNLIMQMFPDFPLVVKIYKYFITLSKNAYGLLETYRNHGDEMFKDLSQHYNLLNFNVCTCYTCFTLFWNSHCDDEWWSCNKCNYQYELLWDYEIVLGFTCNAHIYCLRLQKVCFKWHKVRIHLFVILWPWSYSKLRFFVYYVLDTLKIYDHLHF